MTKTAEHGMRYVILDSNRARFQRFLGNTVYFCKSRAQVAQLYDSPPDNLTWIAYSAKVLDELLKTAAKSLTHGKSRVRKNEHIVTVASPRPESIPALRSLFPSTVGDNRAYRWLPKDELLEVLFGPASNRSNLIIAAAADPGTRTLSLIRGDYRLLVVPFSLCEPAGDGLKPDFTKLGVTDFGRTLKLGAYEASTDAILYETDPEYRKSINRQRKESEQTFGASVLRLRKQRRLSRNDFTPLPAKTIARIERNEVKKPRRASLDILAKRLGVAADELGDY